jgi:hypothetical protein
VALPLQGRITVATAVRLPERERKEKEMCAPGTVTTGMEMWQRFLFLMVHSKSVLATISVAV